MDQDNPAIGRFDQSFLIHMIKDFFMVLLLVTILEFSIKASLVYYDYWANGEDKAQAVAEDLADNIRSIMLNEGGSVAARTMYPILDTNWEDLGFEIAIEPSPVTVTSIEAMFGYRPEGIPTDFPEGAYRSATVEIEAQAFCISCHTGAEVGDILGHVEVRDYLGRAFGLWFEDVRLTAGLAVGKIVLHSVLLFLILRARMEPLLRLRHVVGTLSQAYGGLDQRAEVRTADEFGALARDLNLFLDRISGVVHELDRVLKRVVSVNGDIVEIQGGLREQIDSVVSRTRKLERSAMLSAKREPRLSDAWFDAMRRTLADLEERLVKAGNSPEAESVLEDLRAVVSNAEVQIASSERLYEALAELGDDTEALKGAMSEMTRLEERMNTIIDAGGALVSRLRPEARGRAPAE